MLMCSSVQSRIRAWTLLPTLLCVGLLHASFVVAAKIDELLIKVPYDIQLQSVEGVNELEMMCTLGFDGDTRETERVKGYVLVPAGGVVTGEYQFLFERGDAEGEGQVNKEAGVTRHTMSSTFLLEFGQGKPALFTCYWRSLWRDGEHGKEFSYISTEIAYSPQGSLVPRSDGKPNTIVPERSGRRQEELNASSQVFFNKVFSVAENEASASKVATLSSDVASGPYASVTLPESRDISVDLPPQSNQTNSPGSAATPRSNEAAGDNTPIRLRIEAANICVTKSDDWGLEGSNEDVYGSFSAELKMNDSMGKELIHKVRFVSGSVLKSQYGNLLHVSYSEPAPIGENSCLGDLKQVGEIIVFPQDHGYRSRQDMIARSKLRVAVLGTLADKDMQFGLVAPKLPMPIYEYRLADIPICGTCLNGPGSAKTDKWAVLTAKRPGASVGVMGFFLGDDPNGAFGQIYYNIDSIEN